MNKKGYFLEQFVQFDQHSYAKIYKEEGSTPPLIRALWGWLAPFSTLNRITLTEYLEWEQIVRQFNIDWTCNIYRAFCKVFVMKTVAFTLSNSSDVYRRQIKKAKLYQLLQITVALFTKKNSILYNWNLGSKLKKFDNNLTF